MASHDGQVIDMLSYLVGALREKDVQIGKLDRSLRLVKLQYLALKNQAREGDQ